MDNYDRIEKKLKDEFLKKERLHKKQKGKPRLLQRIRKRNRAMIRRYSKKEKK